MGIFRRKNKKEGKKSNIDKDGFVDLTQSSGMSSTSPASSEENVPANSKFSSSSGSAGENAMGFLGGMAAGASESSKSSGTTQTTGNQEYLDMSNAGISSGTGEDKQVMDEKRRKLSKRLKDLTERMEDLSNQVYHLKNRVEVLEKKNNVSNY